MNDDEEEEHDYLKRLPPEQLQVILAHELCHVRFRDNLWSALHMLVNVVFWFHPVVWWIGAKMVQERERACDESVIRLGSSAEVYAQSIVNVCKFYLESPLPCASGVTGADLRQRIREIMTMRPSYRLTAVRRAALAAAGIAAIGLPTVIGYLRAQVLPPQPRYGYEVVSIRPSTPGETNSRLGPGPQGGLRAQNNTVLMMMTFAYDKREFQFADVPNWVKSLRYDLTLTPDKPEGTITPGMKREEMDGIMGRQRQRLQAVLRDRFGLVLRAETKELPMYGLVIARGGHKLAKAADLNRGPSMNTNRKELTIVSGYLSMFTQGLSTLLGRHVANETGLDGPFDFKVAWTPDSTVQLPGKIPQPDEPIHADDAGGVSIFTALIEQLGLKLESKKGPVPVLVIEKIEKPSEN